jgi:hypothetical protein
LYLALCITTPQGQVAELPTGALIFQVNDACPEVHDACVHIYEQYE